MVRKGKIRASAPGDAILFGEHFVVYGKPALATAINRRLFVTASPREKRGYHIKVEGIPTFGLEIDLKILGKGNGKGKEATKAKAQPYLNSGSATQAITYVKESLRYLEEKYGIEGGMEIEIKSKIPLSAGLGSSAATCVAITAAIKEYFGIKTDLEAIREDALNIEREVQGAASPIDTAISTYGEWVLVEKNEIKRVNLGEINLIIGCIGSISLGMGSKITSEMSLKTKKIVEGVKVLKEAFKSIFNSIFDASDAITLQGLRAIEERDFERLGVLMNINHGLLDAIGVVPRRLSELVKTSQDLGALGAKVTGAGGSEEMGGIGSVLVLPSPSDSSNAAQIKAAMKIAGALELDVKTGVEGLKIDKLPA